MLTADCSSEIMQMPSYLSGWTDTTNTMHNGNHNGSGAGAGLCRLVDATPLACCVQGGRQVVMVATEGIPNNIKPVFQVTTISKTTFLPNGFYTVTGCPTKSASKIFHSWAGLGRP